jgi:hypothetical protein
MTHPETPNTTPGHVHFTKQIKIIGMIPPVGNTSALGAAQDSGCGHHAPSHLSRSRVRGAYSRRGDAGEQWCHAGRRTSLAVFIEPHAKDQKSQL